jgi:phosphotransferase system  glucose/maltose/N-acetylglucosamine-specific IIC component
MRKNMNTLDRRVRTLLVAPALIVAGLLIGPGSVVSIVLYAVAAVMLGTSIVGYCPLYSLLHLDGRGRRPFAH